MARAGKAVLVPQPHSAGSVLPAAQSDEPGTACGIWPGLTPSKQGNRVVKHFIQEGLLLGRVVGGHYLHWESGDFACGLGWPGRIPRAKDISAHYETSPETGLFFRNYPPPADAQGAYLAQEKGHGQGVSCHLGPQPSEHPSALPSTNTPAKGASAGNMGGGPVGPTPARPHPAGLPLSLPTTWPGWWRYVLPLTGERERSSVTGTAPFPVLVL